MPRLCDTDVAQAMATTTTAALLVYIALATGISAVETYIHENQKDKAKALECKSIRKQAFVLRAIRHVLVLYLFPRWFVAIMHTGILVVFFFF